MVGIAILGAKTAGYQSAIMAPTEILAQQHYHLFKETFKDLNVVLLTGSTKKKEVIKTKIASGEIDLVIGTHALITDDTTFKNLGFIVIDEQHRFGVMAREQLELKGNADIVYLTATLSKLSNCLIWELKFQISEKTRGDDLCTQYFTKVKPRVFYTRSKRNRLGNQVYLIAPSLNAELRGKWFKYRIIS